MIRLTPEHMINRGANRACYLHPEDSGRCIKVDLGNARSKGQKANRIEHAHHVRLAQRLGDRFYQHAPRCYGMVETDRGPGLCFEMIRDKDGKPSRRLASYIATTQSAPEHALALVDQLYAFVRDNAVGLFDVNPHNLLVRHDGQGRAHLVVIDWKGPAALREFIPASRFIPLFAHHKKARRFKRLRAQVQEMALGASQPQHACTES